MPRILPVLCLLGLAVTHTPARAQLALLTPAGATAYNAGLRALADGDYALAEKRFDEARTLNPDVREIVDGLLQVYIATKRWEDADTLATASAARWFRSPELLLYEVQARRALGDRVRIAASVGRLANLTPKPAAQIYYELGLEAAEQGDRQYAIACLQRAVVYDEAHAPSRLALAKQLIAWDNKGAARPYLEAYLEMAPKGDGAAEARAILKTY